MACGCILPVGLSPSGLAITSLREPLPDLDHGPNNMARWTRIPLFLWLKARDIIPAVAACTREKTWLTTMLWSTKACPFAARCWPRNTWMPRWRVRTNS
jgi:hypothetical protein